MSTFLAGMAVGYAIGNIGLIVAIGTSISLGYTLTTIVKGVSSLISSNYNGGDNSKENKKGEPPEIRNEKINNVKGSESRNTIK